MITIDESAYVEKNPGARPGVNEIGRWIFFATDSDWKCIFAGRYKIARDNAIRSYRNRFQSAFGSITLSPQSVSNTMRA